MINKKTIQVFADWEEMESPLPMGLLTVTNVKGREVFSFEYFETWLASRHAQTIDPDLQLYTGPQYLRENKSNFGVFLDSSPDRWGKLLMRRREAAIAKREGRPARNLLESDYLLGVYDGHRMGALRFKLEGGDAFLDDNKELASPPWTSIRELEHASLQLEQDNASENPNYLQWLRMLVSPGSSLGGARPKASVLDPQNQLWIAKFPSGNDDIDIGAWEMVAHTLAAKAGIRVAEAKAQRFSSKYHTYLSKRFDRTEQGKRVHFASAMTMLGYNDGNDHQDGISYLEIVEFLIRYGATPDADMEQLWRRIVFNIAIANCDDHLRNHGFLLTPSGWILSPAYDMNPVAYGSGLKLNITEFENALDFDLALEVMPQFRVKHARGKEILAEVGQSVALWRETAKNYGIARSEMEQMETAFRLP
jgi:serine/threonine-protein kinase HipA